MMSFAQFQKEEVQKIIKIKKKVKLIFKWPTKNRLAIHNWRTIKK